MTTPRKTLPVSVRLDPVVKDALDRAAHEDRRSISSLMEKVISDWLHDAGYLSSDRQPPSGPRDIKIVKKRSRA